jgi:hypothetical protein
MQSQGQGKEQHSSAISEINLKIAEIKAANEADREETEAQLASVKKLIAGKLDSVYFDDELDELKQMITVLSEMTSASDNNEVLLKKLKENTQK